MIWIFNTAQVKQLFSFLLIISIAFAAGCTRNDNTAEGKLFIIGGGEKTDSLMNEMVDLSGIRKSGYMVILPMASLTPDSSIIWAREDFMGTGIRQMPAFNFTKGGELAQEKIDSLKNARLIFIAGGDQERFMDVILNTPVIEAIRYARKNGALIAGTSAGAAVMSRKMITGNQLKHPGLELRYPTIEAGNMQIKEGLGFIENAIIDQHFIKRQRLNRLIAVSIENPDEPCIGIDESTAIIVSGNNARVSGRGQVVVIRNRGRIRNVYKGLLGTRDLEVNVYLPGESFTIN